MAPRVILRLHQTALLISAGLCVAGLQPIAEGHVQSQAHVLVSVMDAAGVPIRDLNSDHFAVQIDGRNARIVDARLSKAPAAVVATTHGIDTPNALATRRVLSRLVASARDAGLDTSVGLMLAEGAAVPDMFRAASGADALEAMIQRFARSGRSAPMDESIEAAARALAAAPTDHRVVLLLAERRPNRESFSVPPVARALQEAGVMPWVIEFDPDGPGDAVTSGGDVSFRRIDDSPKYLVETTGGSYERLVGVRAFELAAPRIADSILSQYVVTFETPDRAEGASVRVGVKPPTSSPVRIAAPRVLSAGGRHDR